MVDQICAGVETNSDGVVVSAEAYRELVVEDKVKPSLRKLLGRDGDIRIVKRTNLELYQTRKLWLVNGFHLALAIVGFTQMSSKAKIREVLEHPSTEVQKTIEGLKRELVNALSFRDGHGVFNRRELDVYIQNVATRFRESADTCDRILRDVLLGPDRIDRVTRDMGTALGRNVTLRETFRRQLHECVFAFFSKVHERLYEPLLEHLKQRAAPLELPLVLQQLVPLMVQQGEQLLAEDARDR